MQEERERRKQPMKNTDLVRILERHRFEHACCETGPSAGGAGGVLSCKGAVPHAGAGTVFGSEKASMCKWQFLVHVRHNRETVALNV